MTICASICGFSGNTHIAHLRRTNSRRPWWSAQDLPIRHQPSPKTDRRQTEIRAPRSAAAGRITLDWIFDVRMWRGFSAAGRTCTCGCPHLYLICCKQSPAAKHITCVKPETIREVWKVGDVKQTERSVSTGGKSNKKRTTQEYASLHLCVLSNRDWSER